MKKYVSAYPTLMKEWHREKNVGLTPETVSYGSKKKYGGSVLKVMSSRQPQTLVQRATVAVPFVQEGRLGQTITYALYTRK